MKFRDLDIGDTFDFIGPDPTRTSFYERCTRVSPRCYADARHKYQVGTVNVQVYHATRVHTRLYIVNSRFLSAVINGDYSGLDKEENEKLTAWLQTNTTPAGHWSSDGTEVTYFSQCEVTGMYGDCVDISYVWIEELT